MMEYNAVTTYMMIHSKLLFQVIDDEVLIDDSSHPMETRIVTNLTFEHGTVCQVYGCYEYGDSFQGNLLVYDIKPATCTVAGKTI